MNILTANNISKTYTDKVLLKNVAFSLQEGEKVGVIGINGTGKSTLLRIAAGIEEADSGEVIKGKNIHTCYLPQNPSFPKDATIYSYVAGMNARDSIEKSLEGEAKTILNRLGFTEYDTPVATLSGGQRKRVALAAALLTECEILVLDEPTNHLDEGMVVWLENYLAARRGAVIMVTHDRYFLDRVCRIIWEVDRGELFTYTTNYSGFLALKAEREEMEVAALRKRRSILREEIEWMQRGARARSTKQKAHIQRYENTRDEVSALRTHLSDVHTAQLSSVSSRLGRTTIELEGICKSYAAGNGDGDGSSIKTVISDFSYIFLRDDRVGFVGVNGCGKSTLMNIITGVLEPDSGSLVVGSTVKIGYFSQENEYMDESLRVIDYVKETGEYIETVDGKLTASALCERFLFEGALQYQKIEKLSGGEKRRLYLLKVLMSSPNVLILDEPTNDLDITTLSILEDYIEHFAGIVITVSHDRYFLDRICTRIFAFEGDGHLSQYEGGYSDYVLARPAAVDGASAGSVSGGSEANSSDGQPGNMVSSEEKRQQNVETWKRREQKVRFTYKEEQEYKSIEGEIEKIETRIAEIEAEIPKCATDFVKLNRLMAEKDELEEKLLEKMERWEYLSEKAEQIGQ